MITNLFKLIVSLIMCTPPTKKDSCVCDHQIHWPVTLFMWCHNLLLVSGLCLLHSNYFGSVSVLQFPEETKKDWQLVFIKGFKKFSSQFIWVWTFVLGINFVLSMNWE